MWRAEEEDVSQKDTDSRVRKHSLKSHGGSEAREW